MPRRHARLMNARTAGQDLAPTEANAPDCLLYPLQWAGDANKCEGQSKREEIYLSDSVDGLMILSLSRETAGREDWTLAQRQPDEAAVVNRSRD
jgi:hypothetical protein